MSLLSDTRLWRRLTWSVWVTLTALGALPSALAAVPENIMAMAVPSTLSVGQQTEFIVTVTDALSAPVEGVTVQLVDDGGLDFVTTNDQSTNASGQVSFAASTETPDTYTARFSAQGVTGTIGAQVVFEVGEPSNIGVAADPTTLTVGDTTTFTVTVTDQFNNPVPDFPVEVADAGGLDFPSPVQPTNASGVAGFEATTTGAGVYTVAFSAGPAGSDTAGVTFEAGEAESVAATVEPATPTAGDTATFTVNVADVFGNPVSGVPVTVSDADGLDFSSSSQPTNAAGEAVFQATATVARAYTPEFSAGAAGIDTVTVTFQAGEPANIEADVDPATLEVTETATFTVTVTDANGNPVSGADVDVDDDDGLDFASSSAQTNAAGEAVFEASATTPGIYTAVFSAGPAGTDSAMVTFEVGEPANISAEAEPDTLAVGGTTTFTVTVTDANGNPVPGVDVEVDDNDGLDFTSDSGQTNAAGQAFFEASTTAPGSYTAVFRAGAAGTDSAAVTFEVGAPANISAEADPDTLAVGGTTTFTVTVTDANGNPVPGFDVEVDDNDGLDFTSGSEQTDASGAAIFEASTTTPGSYTAVFSAGPAGTDSATVTFEVGAPANISAQADPTTLVAGGTTTFTVTVTDADDNPVAGFTVEVDDNDGLEFTTASAQTNAAGEAEFEASTTTPGSYTAVFRAGAAGTAPATVTFEIGAPVNISATVDPATLTVGGTATFTVRVTDASDNPIGGVAVEVADDDGLIFVTATEQTNASGEATFQASSETPGTFAAVFSAGAAGTDSATVSFEPGAPQSLAATVAPASLAVGQAATFTVTVIDAFGNAVAGVAVALANDDGLDFASGSAQTNAAGQAAFQASTGTPGTYTAAFSVAGVTGTAEAAVNFEVGNAQNITATAAPSSLEVGDTTIFTVTLTDGFSNPVPGVTVRVEDTGGLDFDSTADQQTDAAGRVTFAATTGDARAYSAVFSAPGAGSATASVIFAAGEAENFSARAEPQILTVGETTVITVTVTDDFGNPIANVTISVEDTDGLDFDSTADRQTNAAGEVTYQATASVPGGYTPAFLAAGFEGTARAGLIFQIGAAADIAAEVEPQMLPVRQTAVFTVTVTDALGNAVGGTTVRLDDAGGLNFASSSERQTNSEGRATFEATADTPGSYSASFSAQGVEGSAVAEVAFETGDAASITVDVLQGVASATGDEELQYRITVFDDEGGAGNPVPGVQVVVTHDGQAIDFTGANEDTATTDADGQAEFSMTSTVAQTVTFTFAVDGQPLSVAADGEFVAPQGQLRIVSGDGQRAEPNATLEEPLVVQIVDEDGNPLAGQEIEFSFAQTPAGAAGHALGVELTTTDAEGTASTTVQLGQAAGEYVVQAVAIAFPDLDPVAFTILVDLEDHPVRDAFSNLTRAFLAARIDRILAAEPRRYRLLHRRALESEPGEFDSSASGNQDRAVGQFSASRRVAFRPFDFWSEGQYSRYSDDRAEARRRADFGILSAGGDYRVREDLVIGLMAQLDWTREESEPLSSRVSGTGWMIGPYVSSEVTEGVFADLRMAYGQSDNSAQIDGLVAGDPYRGGFDTSRWLLRANVGGAWENESWLIKPEASAAYMSESQRTFTVSQPDGVNPVTVDAQSVSIGRFTVGPEINYRVVRQNLLISPYVLPQLHWDFDDAGAVTLGGVEAGADRWSLSLESGVRFGSPFGVIGEISAHYDGIGSSDRQAYGFRLSFSMPLPP